MRPSFVTSGRAKLVVVLLLLAYFAFTMLRTPGTTDSLGPLLERITAGDMASLGDSYRIGERAGSATREAGGLQLLIFYVLVVASIFVFWPRRT